MSLPVAHAECTFFTGTAISEKVQLNLKQLMTFNLTKIMNQYASYVTCIRKFLKRKGVTAKELSVHLLFLPAFNPHIEKKCMLLLDVRDALKKAATVDDIFIALSDICSFLDCAIFQSIAEEYDIDQSQEQFWYPDCLKVYMESHKISEFVMVNPLLKKLVDSSSQLFLKFDIQATCTLADLDKLKLTVANLLGLEAAALRLLDINEGCVIATYLISPSIAGIVFTSDKQFTAMEKEQFLATSVQWLKYGERTFSFGRGDSVIQTSDATIGNQIESSIATIILQTI